MNNDFSSNTYDKNDDFIVFSSVNKDGLEAAWDAILEKI